MKKPFVSAFTVLLLIVTALVVLQPGIAATRPSPEDIEPVTAIIVRHAEASEEPENDPVLNDKGSARAQALAAALAESGVTAVYATHLQRTQLTVKPVADNSGLEIKTMQAGDIDGTVAAIRSHPGGVVLFAGHSNTINKVITGLGGGPMADLEHSSYDNLFIVTAWADGRGRLLRLKYGN